MKYKPFYFYLKKEINNKKYWWFSQENSLYSFMWINNGKKEGIFIREILEGYIFFLKKGIMSWLEYHLKLLRVLVVTLCMLVIDFFIYLFFYLIFTNNIVVVFVLFLFFILLDSFVVYAIFREYWLKEVC